MARRTTRTADARKKPRMEIMRGIAEHRQNTLVQFEDDQHPVLVDAYTASMLVAVHDRLSPEYQKKFIAVPIDKMVTMGWHLYNKARDTK